MQLLLLLSGSKVWSVVHIRKKIINAQDMMEGHAHLISSEFIKSGCWPKINGDAMV